MSPILTDILADKFPAVTCRLPSHSTNGDMVYPTFAPASLPLPQTADNRLGVVTWSMGKLQ